MDLEKFKPFLLDFIEYYHKDLGNGAGGYLHIALDYGSLGEEFILFCQQDTKKVGDTFGYFLATLMRYFTEYELEAMYENDWKNVKA